MIQTQRRAKDIPARKRSEVVSVRLRPEMKARLDAERKKHNRKLREEIELRLQRALDLDQIMERTWGKRPETRAFAVLIGRAAMAIETYGDFWRSSAEAHQAFRAAIDTLLQFLAPAHSGKLKQWLSRPGARANTPEAL